MREKEEKKKKRVGRGVCVGERVNHKNKKNEGKPIEIGVKREVGGRESD